MNKIFLAQQMNRFVQMSVQSANLTDEKAMEVADLYPEWAATKAYPENEIVKYGVNADGETQLYKVIQAHTSQADWTPPASPSLWKRVADPAEEWPEWSQPVGAHDAYNAGDKVSHGGKHWISDQDGNVWEPGVYGWTEVVAEV